MNRLTQRTMELLIRQSTRTGRCGRLVAMSALLVSALQLAACGGGGVNIGSGQDADPVVVDFPIAFIKAPLPIDDNGDYIQDDLRIQDTFNVGSDLYYKDRASPVAEAINITDRFTHGQGAVRDVEISYDGKNVLFAMRGPFDPDLDDDEQPTWNLWEYTLASDDLHRLIKSDLTAEIGQDIMPKYLPDGRIVFSSTRQLRSQAMLLDEGKPGFSALDEDRNLPAFNLHVMNGDGSNIEQISFNQSNDLDASVMANGQIVFSRWDHAGPANDGVNLYRMNPDGSNLELLYGQQSHATGTNGELVQFMQPREMEDGRVLALIRPFTDTEGGGDAIFIDTPEYLENTQPTRDNIGVLTGPAQAAATTNKVSTLAGVPSRGGRYASVYPILDGTGRMLVAWSPCRVQETQADMTVVTHPCTDELLADPDVVVAPPLYGIWMYDPRENTQRPVVPGEDGFIYTEVAAADPRSAPIAIPDGMNNFQGSATLADKSEAVLNIRNVYDFDGQLTQDVATLSDPAQTMAADRPARFLRIEKAVSIPDKDIVDLDNTAFGVTTDNGMREIVGYAMIEPDGSVMTKVPANAALMVSVLDANGKRITPRHNNWIELRPGQELTCNGCHTAGNGTSHGRRDAFNSAYAGAPVAGVSFPNTDPQWFVGEVGETMAEVRARITCSVDGCSSLEPTMDVVYHDVWTDPNVRAPDPDIDIRYSDLTTLPPTSLACQQKWVFNCRSVINYETIIHPLWNKDRPVVDAMGNPVLDGNGVQKNQNCLQCHTPVDPANGQVRVPAGQLELEDGPSVDEPDQFNAYRELLVTDNLQVVNNGALVDALDANGAPIPIPAPASTAGANASGRFFSRFEDPQDSDHYNSLSKAELRLIAEWLDVGAQYYNNPFDVPVN